MTTALKRHLIVYALFFMFAWLAVNCFHPDKVMAGSEADFIRIGFSKKAFVNVPNPDMKIAVAIFSRKITSKTFASLDSKIYDSPSDIENDLKLKNLDVVAITPDEFIQLRNRVAIEPAVVTVVGNSPEIELLLLVRKDSGLNKVVDLKGKTFALPSWNVQYGSIYRTWIETLLLNGITNSMNDFFSSIKETDSATQAIIPVFFRQTAACVVSKQAFDISSELNPQISRELKAIAHIGGLAGGLVVFRKDLPEAKKQKTMQALLSLDKDQEGRQLLMLFHLNRLAPFRPEYLQNTEALYSKHAKMIALKQ